MTRNQPEYDHWLNKYHTDPAYRAMFWDRIMWAVGGFWLGVFTAMLFVAEVFA